MSAGWAHRVVRSNDDNNDNHHDDPHNNVHQDVTIIMFTDHHKIEGWTHRVVRSRHSYSFCNWLPVQVDLFNMREEIILSFSTNYFLLN